MLTKFLLTTVVIIACLWILAARGDKPKVVLNTIISKKDQQRQKMFRQGAWAFMLVMILVAVVIVSLEQLDKNTIVKVRIWSIYES